MEVFRGSCVGLLKEANLIMKEKEGLKRLLAMVVVIQSTVETKKSVQLNKLKEKFHAELF